MEDVLCGSIPQTSIWRAPLISLFKIVRTYLCNGHWALGQRMSIFSLKTSGHPPCLSECRGQSGCHGKASRCLSATVMGHLKSVSTLPTALLRLPTPPAAGGAVSNLVQAGRRGGRWGAKKLFQLNWTGLPPYSAFSLPSPNHPRPRPATLREYFARIKLLGNKSTWHFQKSSELTFGASIVINQIK